MHDSRPCARFGCDSKLLAPREETRARRRGRLDRSCNRRAGDIIRVLGASDRNRFWAVLLMLCGEFQEFGTAYYHSAVNYTTLGYGDLLMTPSWRLLGPLEAANGALMFGVSTAMIFAVIQRLILDRFVDLRD